MVQELVMARFNGMAGEAARSPMGAQRRETWRRILTKLVRMEEERK